MEGRTNAGEAEVEVFGSVDRVVEVATDDTQPDEEKHIDGVFDPVTSTPALFRRVTVEVGRDV